MKTFCVTFRDGGTLTVSDVTGTEDVAAMVSPRRWLSIQEVTATEPETETPGFLEETPTPVATLPFRRKKDGR